MEKVNRDGNFNKPVRSLTIAFAVVLLYSCSLFGPGPPVMADAEITGISSQSDTSVIVKIDKYRNSTAYIDCLLLLTVDTVALETFQGYPSQYPHPVSRECKLDEHYEMVIGGLKKGRTYIFQLFSAGTFDIGSPKTMYKSKEIGKRWEYVMP